jgi:hypothetical protein
MRRPLAKSSTSVHQRLLLTLLFLGAVGLHRPWDLRGYTAEHLARLTGRKRAYGYHYTERFLSQVAHAGGAESLTDALAQWTTALWHPKSGDDDPHQWLTCYIDGHRKPVYSDVLIPRGLIGRLGVIQGCRALVLLHDDQGHPLLATTHREDQHLTMGLPALLNRYEQAEQQRQVKQIIVDREGMAVEFLASLQAAGREVITILRTDQYRDLTSFTEVGTFVPFSRNTHGQLIREVASARIAFPRPEHSGEVLSLHVALIRDLRRMVTLQREPGAPVKRELKTDGKDECRWAKEGWQATPTPALPLTPKLIPIVSTAEMVDAVELAQTYIHRWPVQENVIKDFLRPLGLDTNHGFTKTQIPNSEGSKQRSLLQRRLARLKQWATSAGKRHQKTKERYARLRAQQQQQCQIQAAKWGWYQTVPTLCSGADPVKRKEIKERNAKLDEVLRPLTRKVYEAEQQCKQELAKQEHYCQEQCQVLRALEDLAAKERSMYELDHRKDQVMTVCKVALANVAMWVRDRYFPTSYAHATWQRLLPFFQLPGTIVCDSLRICVELTSFNDRALNRDLEQFCERVNQISPRLPDGRQLSFIIHSTCRILSTQKSP